MKKLAIAIALVVCFGAAIAFAAAEKEVKTSIDKVPAKVKEVIEKETQGATIKEIEEETKGDKTTYEVEFTKDGKKTEICIAPDGTIVKDDDDDKKEAKEGCKSKEKGEKKECKDKEKAEKKAK
jgi:hypothetical protein